MKPYHICNLNFHTSVGGTQHTLRTILKLLSSHFRVTVLDPYRSASFAGLLQEAGILVEPFVDFSRQPYVSQRRGLHKIFDVILVSPRYVAAGLKFRRFVRQRAVDVVYVNQTKSALFAIMATPRRVPIVFHCHGIAATGIKVVYRFRRRLACVIANSRYTAEQLKILGFAEDQIVVVENVLAVDEIQIRSKVETVPGPPYDSDWPVILVAHAGIEPNKGTLLAIEAFGQLAQEGLPGKLWIAGDEVPAYQGYAQFAHQRVAQLGVTERVHFIGRQADIYPFMARAAIIIIPSLVAESFGRVAAEAMVLGKAVVVSNRGALPSIVEDGKTGRVFDPEVSGALASVLIELITTPALVETYGRQAALAARQRHSLSAYQEQLSQVFWQVMATAT